MLTLGSQGKPAPFCALPPPTPPLGSLVLMPPQRAISPSRRGGFLARVRGVVDNGILVVEDSGGELFAVEASLVERFEPEEQ